MSTQSRKILVPFDYTELSNNALNYAVLIAKTVEANLVLLHVIKDIKDEAEELKKLQVVADTTSQKYGITIEPKIRAGVIHNIIKLMAINIDAFMVIMKTQPPRGKEKFLRSRSIRVMMGSKIPFLVVQEPPKRLAFRKVVFPIDFRKENKEKLIWVNILSKFYTSKIFFFKPGTKEYRVKANLDFSRRFLEGKNIDYEIISGKNNIANASEIIEFAHEIDAQLIIIMLSRKISFFSNLFKLDEQSFISNKYKIPVMCINPRAEVHKYEGWY